MKAPGPKRYRQHRWVGMLSFALDPDEVDGFLADDLDHVTFHDMDPASPPRVYCMDCEKLYEQAGERCTAPPRELFSRN
jgi:hypothetical protein